MKAYQKQWLNDLKPLLASAYEHKKTDRVLLTKILGEIMDDDSGDTDELTQVLSKLAFRLV